MSTGAVATNLTPRRLLGGDDLANGVIGYLSNDLRDVAKYTFRKGGVFDTAVSLVSGGTDRVSISPVTETYTDGLGRIFKPDAALGQGIRFQNTAAVVYQVALKWAQRPRGLAINPRSGKPEIQQLEDTIGESGAPNSVGVQGAGLKIVIDSLCEVGVSHAGRSAVVWKITPGDNALTEGVAVETLTVQYDGANNFVVTAAQFGQATPSTNAALYRAVVLGPSVKRNTSMVNVAGYAFVGTVTGAGAGIAPSTFSMTNQRVIDSSLSGIDDITRTGTNGSLKVSVRADVGDANENQLEARNASNVVRFAVDEDGDTTISGLLTTASVVVGGALTVVGATALNGSVAIGDADADSHSIKGSLTHLTVSNSVTSLAVNAATGRVGIGQAAPGSGFLGITGAVAIVGATTLTGSMTISGSLAATASVSGNAGLTGTGNGTGSGVVGTGGATTGSIGVIGSGGAGVGHGVRGSGSGAGGTGIIGIASSTGLGASFTGGSLGGVDIDVTGTGAIAIGGALEALALRNTTNANASKVLLSFLHADATSARDGWGIYTQRVADSDVDFKIASIIDGVVSDKLIYDGSVDEFRPAVNKAVTLGNNSFAFGVTYSNGLVVGPTGQSPTTITGAAVTVALTGNPSFLDIAANASSGRSITAITGGVDGQILICRVSTAFGVVFNHSATFVTGGFKMAGSANATVTAGSTLSFVGAGGGMWYEISRSLA